MNCYFNNDKETQQTYSYFLLQENQEYRQVLSEKCFETVVFDEFLYPSTFPCLGCRALFLLPQGLSFLTLF